MNWTFSDCGATSSQVLFPPVTNLCLFILLVLDMASVQKVFLGILLDIVSLVLGEYLCFAPRNGT